MRLIEEHVAVTPAERMAIALWTFHTYVFERFSVAPRLAALSPTTECGKTTVLILLEHLVRNSFRADDVTAASIYNELYQNPYVSLLIDEGDNLGLFENPQLRAVLNSGHRRGGRIARVIRGVSQWFPTFAPVAIAAIGTLPLPLLRRSIVIEMTRRASDQPPLRRLDESDPAFAVAREEISDGRKPVSLRMTPKYRRNFAIAPQIIGVCCWPSPTVSGMARPHGQPRLNSARTIRTRTSVRTPSGHSNGFLGAEADRLASAILVADLNALDDLPWSEWRGLDGHDCRDH